MSEDLDRVQEIVRNTSSAPGSRTLSTRSRSDVLAENTFGIVSGDTDVQDKLLRMVALVPMALEVVDEARDTIERLRTEVETLRAEAEVARSEAETLRAECEAATVRS